MALLLIFILIIFYAIRAVPEQPGLRKRCGDCKVFLAILQHCAGKVEGLSGEQALLSKIVIVRFF
jgi:hypothetical protein